MSLIVNKYKPMDFCDMISQKNIINILKEYIKNNDFPNCILFGPPGIGKTSIINVAINKLFNIKFDKVLKFSNNKCNNILWINAAEERGIQNTIELVNTFIKSNTLFNNNIKIIIFDECDNFTIKSQIYLKNFIGIYPHIKYCFICNNITKIIPSLISKCLLFKFVKCSYDDIYNKIVNICINEQIKISPQAINKIIINNDYDIRAILNTIQYYKLLYFNTIIYSQYITSDYKINIIQLYRKIRDKQNYYNKIKLLYYIEKYILLGKDNKIIKTLINYLTCPE